MNERTPITPEEFDRLLEIGAVIRFFPDQEQNILQVLAEGDSVGATLHHIDEQGEEGLIAIKEYDMSSLSSMMKVTFFWYLREPDQGGLATREDGTQVQFGYLKKSASTF